MLSCHETFKKARFTKKPATIGIIVAAVIMTAPAKYLDKNSVRLFMPSE